MRSAAVPWGREAGAVLPPKESGSTPLARSRLSTTIASPRRLRDCLEGNHLSGGAYIAALLLGAMAAGALIVLVLPAFARA